MKRLTKNMVNRQQGLAARLEEAAKAIADAQEALGNAVSTYNDVLSDAREFRDELVSDMDSFASERSDKWQESEAGQEYDAWKDEWEQLDLDDIDPPEEYELEHADSLDQLNDQPGSL
jgi:hypothetical protein